MRLFLVNSYGLCQEGLTLDVFLISFDLVCCELRRMGKAIRTEHGHELEEDGMGLRIDPNAACVNQKVVKSADYLERIFAGIQETEPLRHLQKHLAIGSMLSWIVGHGMHTEISPIVSNAKHCIHHCKSNVSPNL